MADAVAFGRMFVATPDLPERIRIGAEIQVMRERRGWMRLLGAACTNRGQSLQ